MSIWFGKLPESWQAVQMRQLFSERSTKVSDKDYAPLTVGYMGVVPQLANVAKTDNGDNRKLIKKGDFAINSRSDRKGAGGISEYDGSCSVIITVLKPHHELNGRFYHYLLRSHYFSEEFYRNGYGIVDDLWSTKWKTMRTIYLPVPPREEQDQIVRFLDWKVSEINRLIAVKKREIGLFDELKRNTISRVLNCDIYPKIRFKYCAWIRARLGWRGLKAHEYVDSGFPFLSAFNIVNDEMNWENLNYINQDRYDESPEIKLSVGDILLVKDGAGIGKCAKIDNLPYGESTPNGSLAVITPNSNIYYKFLYYFLISADFKNISNRILTGMGVPHLTQHFLKNVEIPCPDYDVQQSIAETLEKKCIAFNDSISKINAEIEKLEELKKRLISDVVTGQIDVRNIEIPEFEYVEESAKSPEEMETDTDEEV